MIQNYRPIISATAPMLVFVATTTRWLQVAGRIKRWFILRPLQAILLFLSWKNCRSIYHAYCKNIISSQRKKLKDELDKNTYSLPTEFQNLKGNFGEIFILSMKTTLDENKLEELEKKTSDPSFTKQNYNWNAIQHYIPKRKNSHITFILNRFFLINLNEHSVEKQAFGTMRKLYSNQRSKNAIDNAFNDTQCDNPKDFFKKLEDNT